MLEEDRTALCGPRYAHTAVRHALRGHGTGARRPSSGRAGGGPGGALAHGADLAQTDPLNRRVVEQMLVGVATRQYARSLEPLPAGW